MRVSRADEKILEFAKPKLEESDNINFENNQTLILCAGFEDRSVYVANLLSKSSVDKFYIILINYLPEIGENRFEEIRRLCKDKNYGLIELTYDRHKPDNFSGQVASKIKNMSANIWLDISGMSRLLIVQLVSNIMQNPNLSKRSKILYCEAERYPPDEKEAALRLRDCEASPYVDFSFLSAGIYDIAAISELATVSVGACPSYLVSFPSFNPAQLAVVIENAPPAEISLIHGVPPSSQLRWRTSVIKKMNVLSEGFKIQDEYFSTLYYQETLNYLLKIYGEITPFYDLVISPTGSKMQAVAVGIFRGFFKDVQIIYPTHKEFTNPASYTTGVGSLYKLDLSSFASLRSKLRKTYQGF